MGMLLQQYFSYIVSVQSERSLHILSEMIWLIDHPILLAPYFLIVQSEELLLLKPVILTKMVVIGERGTTV
jgi:hypothetical protein